MALNDFHFVMFHKCHCKNLYFVKNKMLLYKCIQTTLVSSLFQETHAITSHLCYLMLFNSLRPRQNRCHFADDVFRCNSLNENAWIQIKISLKFVPKGPINNIPALVQIMAWRRTGDKPLSEPMMTQSNDAYMRHSASMSWKVHLALLVEAKAKCNLYILPTL